MSFRISDKPEAPAPAPDHSAELAELAQWRAMFPALSPSAVREIREGLLKKLGELEAELESHRATTRRPEPKTKPKPKTKKAKK